MKNFFMFSITNDTWLLALSVINCAIAVLIFIYIVKIYGKIKKINNEVETISDTVNQAEVQNILLLKLFEELRTTVHNLHNKVLSVLLKITDNQGSKSAPTESVSINEVPAHITIPKKQITWEIVKKYTRNEIKNNPNKLYIFGDNDERRGLGGQAHETRGNVNVFGICTVCFNRTTGKSLHHYVYEDLSTLAYLVKNNQIYDVIVFPEDGIGTGISGMSKDFPDLFITLYAELVMLGLPLSAADAIVAGPLSMEKIQINPESHTEPVIDREPIPVIPPDSVGEAISSIVSSIQDSKVKPTPAPKRYRIKLKQCELFIESEDLKKLGAVFSSIEDSTDANLESIFIPLGFNLYLVSNEHPIEKDIIE